MLARIRVLLIGLVLVFAWEASASISIALKNVDGKDTMHVSYYYPVERDIRYAQYERLPEGSWRPVRDLTVSADGR